LDLERGFLRRDETDVPLRPKAYDALAYLVARHGKLVTKAELIAAVWPATSVTDNSLSHCLLEIRRALGDESQQLIRTVARRGYVFAAPVTAGEESPRPDRGRSAPDLQPTAADADAPIKIKRHSWRAAGFLAAPAFALSGLLFLWPAPPPGLNVTYTELTHLTDSATNPALSPDGRMVAFIAAPIRSSTPDSFTSRFCQTGSRCSLRVTTV
jgi:DNA-binding winged helix-turn-helix (wHTH) protein